jgi:hypothetical protein
MRQVNNITSEPIQLHTLLVDDFEIEVQLRFLPEVQIWLMSVTLNSKVIHGIKLSGGVLHMRGYNFPFDFAVEVTDGSGLDPFRIDDFETERCQLFYVTVDEMTDVRGLEVQA